MDRLRPMRESGAEFRATVMILLAALLWSLMAPISRGLFACGLDPLTVVQLRTAIAGLVLLLGLRLVRGSWARVRGPDRWLMLAYGGCIAGNYLTYFHSMNVGTVTVAAVALHIYPALVAVAARLWFGELFGWRKLVSIGIAAVGLVLLTEATDPSAFVEHAAGVGYGLLSAVFLTGHTLMAKRLVERYDPWTLIQYGFLVAGGVLTVAGAFGGAWQFEPSFRVAGLMAALVAASTIGAYGLFTSAIRVLPVGRAGIITLSETVWVMAWGVLLLGESTTGLQYVGAVLIMASVALVLVDRPQMVRDGTVAPTARG